MDEPNAPACAGDGGDAVSEPSEKSPQGVSPYATGGGGVTFERKVAVQYLAHLLVGDGAAELGDGRRVVSVAFQQAPDHPVDDLVVHAARADEREPSLVLALGVRRSPRMVPSDADTRRLIRGFVSAVTSAPSDGREHRLALVVAGPQRHAEQLATLADHAAVQMDAPGFFELVRTPKKFDGGIRKRLAQFEKLVGHALDDLGVSDRDPASVEYHTWQLLSMLTVLMPRLESPDGTDWADLLNRLVRVARGTDLAGALPLRDRLVALAGDYSPKAAQVDLTMLRRHAHAVLDTSVRRHVQGSQRLDLLHEQALASVRDAVATSDGDRSWRLDRDDAAAALRAAAGNAAAMVVTGESGVGKSSLAMQSFTAGVADPGSVQARCVNLRHVPALAVEFENMLGAPLSSLLGELSAPMRVLVVDGADAIAEGRENAFRYLVDAAREGDVKVVAVCAEDTKQIVHDALAERLGAGVSEFAVSPLTDAEVGDIVRAFPELGNLAADARSRELLRRLVVVDLLIRSHVSGVLLTDADAMDKVWSGLVRRHEASDRGFPEARSSVMLQLADLELSGGDRLNVLSEIDQAALDGLRRDGLLRTSPDNPFRIGPEFAHDEVRRYAVARLLLGDKDLVSKIFRAGAPRWSLSAARLACQAWLARADSVDAPLQGRFVALQASFDAVVEAGHGARWGDVPGESLLALPDPGGLLGDAWPELRADDNAGLRRLARLAEQRFQDDDGSVKTGAVEPLITPLLEDDAPWQSGDYAERLLREWLRAHVVANTPAGHPLRVLLRTRLVEACSEADRRHVERLEAEAAARAARTPEEIKQERIAEERASEFLTAIGDGNRRERREIPYEITCEIIIELFALLGPDLGTDGEAILRRVGRDAPWELAPAVEELLTGRALASYDPLLLATLTETYYLDDDAVGYELFDDGIRQHCARSLGLTPQCAWYLGPFVPLLQSDFRVGILVLNRLLNHATRVRIRILETSSQTGSPLNNDTVSPHQTELEITGSRQLYVGDEHVWIWYRGAGVGPPPCMSALLALEHWCDQLIKAGVPIKALIAILLDGCENLAMIGLIVGILVRHLEAADGLLDPYLSEPLIWKYEFRRVAEEAGLLAASSDEVTANDRRSWSLREAAGMMVLGADDERLVELRMIGKRLVENACREAESAHEFGADVAQLDVEETIGEELAMARLWASSLDRDSYHAHEIGDGLYVQVAPPEDVVDTLQSSTEDLQRAEEDARLFVRYHIKPAKGRADIIGSDELAVDIASARDLLDNPPCLDTHRMWDTPATVAAAALQAYVLRRVELPDTAVVFAVDTVLRIGEGAGPPLDDEFELTNFERGANRSAARAVPLFLLPVATPLRVAMDGRHRDTIRRKRWRRRGFRRTSVVDDIDGRTTLKRAKIAGIRLARTEVYEVRLHLARGLDHLWESQCAGDDNCHHEAGILLATETMRDCVLGAWNQKTGRRVTIILKEPVTESLERVAGDSINSFRLDAAIRALAPAATANICVSTRARALLLSLLDAQRRSLLNNERKTRDPDYRGTHSIVAARALLMLAEDGGDEAIDVQIAAYADSSAMLANFLRALSAAAEETADRAAAARRIWPRVVRRVLGLNDSEYTPFEDHYYGEMALAALIPNIANEAAYLYSEVQDEPIKWWDPLALRPEVEAWLEVAEGNPTCVDQLVIFLDTIVPEDQARTGLPWVARLVLADPVRVAGRCWMLSDWLIEMRSPAADVDLEAMWQEVVDALVVAGDQRLAPYSE